MARVDPQDSPQPSRWPSVLGPAFDPRTILELDPWPLPRELNALQRARFARGISQDELAAELDVSRQTVSSLENRRRTPSVSLALAVARALHASVEELFGPVELPPAR
jgi:putative transcriptional regulator